jgi:hypothetical protein
MGDFKAIAMDYEYHQSLLDVGRLYCLSDRQIYILLAQLEYVSWLTRWYNIEDITQKTVGFIRSDLEEALLSCVDVSILVDQAALNLVDTTTSRILASQALRDLLEDRYDGSPTSINPSAPTTNFGSSGDRYDALCAGLTAFVYQFARNQSDSIRAGQVGGLLAVALIAALLIPGLNIFFIVGASIAVVLGLGTIGVTTEVAINALTDQTALGNVICCMRGNLKAQSVTAAHWLTALDGCAFGSGSNEQIVSDFLGAVLADNYLTILNILGQAYDGVVGGEALPECPCGEFCWVQDLKTDISNMSLVYTQDGFDYRSAHVDGYGIVGDRPGLLDENIPKITLPAARPITQVTLVVDVTDNNLAAAYLFIDGVFEATQSLVNGINTVVFNVDNKTANFIQLGADRSGNTDRTQIGPLTSFTIKGTGGNPFGTSNC